MATVKKRPVVRRALIMTSLFVCLCQMRIVAVFPEVRWGSPDGTTVFAVMGDESVRLSRAGYLGNTGDVVTLEVDSFIEPRVYAACRRAALSAGEGE